MIDPRCLILRGSQRLRVQNRTDSEITVTLGRRHHAAVPANGSYTFAQPVGEFLAPGVFELRFTDAAATSIWVDPVCHPDDSGMNCVTSPAPTGVPS